MNTYRSLKILGIVVVLTLGTWLPDVQAGCTINVFVKNSGKARIRISNTTNYTGAKSKGGLWRRLGKGLWFSTKDSIFLDPGKTTGDNYFADFRCGAKRRYRVFYQCKEGKYKGRSFSAYYPSSTTWTTRQSVTVSLGHCK